MVTQLPDTTGLPVWAQILVSILICVGALAAAFSGYFKKTPPPTEATLATVAGATLMDNLSIRQLSDALAVLSNDVVSLEREMKDNIHWTRTKVEQDREICQRLRELREALDRMSKG